MRSSLQAGRWKRGAIAALLWCLPAMASAEATVTVKLHGPGGQPADGKVQLALGDTTHTCQTQAGVCEIKGVAGGLYKVTVHQAGKQAPKPKQVMIPPSGEVSLILQGGK